MQETGAGAEQAETNAAAAPVPVEEQRPETRVVERASIAAPPSPVGPPYSDLPLRIEVELDRKRMTVREILRLRPGSVLRMTRSAGENIDIRVGGALMGFGEIVILEERMGVRITDFHEID